VAYFFGPLCIYKLQHLQFGAANCRLPAAPHFYLVKVHDLDLSVYYC